MNSETVDLIYLDPPFNSNANYAAPIGSVAAGAEFKDTWTLSDIDVEWINLMEAREPSLYRVLLSAMRDSDKSYLAYMAVRLLEMRRLLKETGSIYLHCDPTMSHYLKLVMDAIFGRDAFRREIVWNLQTSSGFKSQVNGFVRGHDVILYYGRAGFIFNKQYLPHKEAYKARFRKKDGDGRFYRDDRSGGRRQYLDQTRGVMLTDVWSDIMSFQQAATSAEIVGYPTQKPLALLERIIAASSNEGDVVLDPFAGCATTCVAAEKLDREWVGIDLSPKAAELVNERLRGEMGDLFHHAYVTSRADIPPRTDLGNLQRYNSAFNKNFLYGEQSGDCAGCRTHFEKRHLEVDHIIARAKGGTDHLDNLQLLCGHCNAVKGDRGMEYLRIKLQLVA
ncbi:MAG: DNA methyltransferase [Acidimicrobiaceae bacterium]|nr:DNA methyltransferase [Acidimicrobiaceae bacterium]